MNRKTAVFLTCLIASASSAVAQLRPRPYDAVAVRRTAVEVQRRIADIQRGVGAPGGDESGLGELAQFLVESLMTVDARSPIDSEVLDALAAMAGTGWMVEDALLARKELAVPALIRSAKTVGGLSGQRKGAMDTLEQMLERPEIEQSLSVPSKSAIHRLAQDTLADPTLEYSEVGSAGYLAIATRDPALRAIAARLLQPEELRRRRVDPSFHEWTIEVIGQALAKFSLP